MLAHLLILVLLWHADRSRPQFLPKGKQRSSVFLAAPPAMAAAPAHPNRAPIPRPRVLSSITATFRVLEPPIPEKLIRPPEISVAAEPVSRAAPLPHDQNPVASAAPVAPVGGRKDVRIDSFEQTASPKDSKKVSLAASSAGFSDATIETPIRGRSPATARPGNSFGDAVGNQAPARNSFARTKALASNSFEEGAHAAQLPSSTKVVRDAAFAAAAAAPAIEINRRRDSFSSRPVEIVRKPRPEYTEEGRKKQIEGDVLIEVLFRANGELRVERLIRGLGYGLDENAMKAARAIQFRPALERGTEVDSVGTIRISFQLAY